MAISMPDQMMFPLICGHEVVLGRLQGMERWTCETCGKQIDLTGGFRSMLVRDLDTAVQIDLQAQARGEKVERLG